MKRCVIISFDIFDAPKDILSFIQKVAKDLQIEGTVQVVETKILKIIAQGKSENVEKFLDAIHAGYNEWLPSNITEEPFLSNRDYRGTFRIIQ